MLMNIELLFDGGGTREMEAYGSYRITNGDKQYIGRVIFGTGFSNNEAEYMTLIAGLEYILTGLEKRGKPSFDVTLIVKGDSMLVKEQIGIPTHIGAGFDRTEWKGWKLKAKHLEPLRDKARRLLLQFYRFEYQHIPRKEVVAVLGH